ncbi:hypothetical protein [Bacillus sp. T3]|uniref:tetratricopeptide repeat protein n=1 Tax=Bacillus sp. T3 TaxID=467262 RepID=UPI0029812362|nr:hypothetical protein [Bacillus sp. T3]
MEQLIQLYNRAIAYMQDEMYEEASNLLEPILKEEPSFVDAVWALGLIDVLTGFPHQAIEKWKVIREVKDIDILQAVEKVEQKLPLYDRLYDKNNEAIEQLQRQNFQVAANIFDELLVYQKEVPLPISFYFGAVLTKIVIGAEKFAFDEIISFPAYVRKNEQFQEVEELLHYYLEKFRNSKVMFKDKKTHPKPRGESWYYLLYRKILLAFKNT